MTDDGKTAPLNPTASPLNGHPPDGAVEAMQRRIAELETALAKMTRQRDETRRMFFELYAELFPDDPPPSEDELLAERKTLTDASISQMIAELEGDAGGNRP